MAEEKGKRSPTSSTVDNAAAVSVAKAKKELQKKLQIGAKMPDGTIYLGFYSKKDWFVAAEDAKDNSGKNLVMNFNKAAEYAKVLKAHGHQDWMVPPGKNDQKEPDILNEMFNNKSNGAFKGTYDKSGSNFSGWYWSSTPNPDGRAWGQRFSDGGSGWGGKNGTVSVRCVRAVARP